jgi:hypothetical protein
MTIREKMKELGNGKYEIKISEPVYVGSYGMGGYMKEITFNLLVKDKNVYSESIYKNRSYDRSNKEYIEDKFDKMYLVSSLLAAPAESEQIEKFVFKEL